ncbi:hydroxymethylbilane synthase [Flavobacteriales bacterium]|nr:hydroxymethylbilane synthase [Flavobacteriales bacterium]
MQKKITIGSRGSNLALWQANFVKYKLSNLGVDSDIKIIKTNGDKIQNLSFDKMEGKGFFTKEIENALLKNKIDLAVHSLKDLETDQPNGLCIAAIPKREDADDVLLINSNSVDESQVFNVIKSPVVGTSSARRKNQLLLFREDVVIKDMRGNVPTRINKLRTKEYDAIVLAKAGLNRLKIDLSEFYVQELSVNSFIPAPGQGALALQTRESDKDLKRILEKISHKDSQENVNFEREILNGINGSCHSPLGVYSVKDQNGVRTSWVSYSDKVNETPIRFISKSSDTKAIVNKINSKIYPFSIWISRILAKDSVFNKLTKSSPISLTAESLIEMKILKIDSLPSCDWIFINSAFAVNSIMYLKNSLKSKKIAAFGQSTAKYLQKSGLKVEFVGEGVPSDVAQSFSSILKSEEKVFFPSSNRSLGTVQSVLENRNKIVLETYQTLIIDKKVENHDFLVFTSPSNVEAFLLSNKVKNQKIISIGPSTTKALNNAGIINILESFQSTELALADAVFSLI